MLFSQPVRRQLPQPKKGGAGPFTIQAPRHFWATPSISFSQLRKYSIPLLFLICNYF
ncbi:hypothetical protein HMPREF0262_01283 [Clostridium sp. ATCC 29733]|nr:hypothetical protein HMPREF0262_01283 [Clostridium sp. ATCC 29733]